MQPTIPRPNAFHPVIQRHSPSHVHTKPELALKCRGVLPPDVLSYHDIYSKLLAVSDNHCAFEMYYNVNKYELNNRELSSLIAKNIEQWIVQKPTIYAIGKNNVLGVYMPLAAFNQHHILTLVQKAYPRGAFGYVTQLDNHAMLYIFVMDSTLLF